MRDKVSDENRAAIIARAESSLRGRAAHFGERRDVFLILHTGELSERAPANREKAVRAFEAKLARLYRGRKGVAEEAVLRDPEIYGLPFVDEEWSFLEKSYRDQVQSWRYATPAAGLAGLVGAGFALFGGVQHVQALAAGYEFDNRRAELHETLADIERILPSEQAMASARSGLQVQMDSLSEVRLDRMLDWVTHLVPEDMAIRKLEVKPVPPPRGGGRNRVVEYPPGEKPFQVRIEIVLAETAFDAAEAVSGDLVKHLSQRLQIVGSRLDVPAPEPGVGRKVALVVDAQARAVNF
jgi:hypothetical protein